MLLDKRCTALTCIGVPLCCADVAQSLRGVALAVASAVAVALAIEVVATGGDSGDWR